MYISISQCFFCCFTPYLLNFSPLLFYLLILHLFQQFIAISCLYVEDVFNVFILQLLYINFVCYLYLDLTALILILRLVIMRWWSLFKSALFLFLVSNREVLYFLLTIKWSIGFVFCGRMIFMILYVFFCVEIVFRLSSSRFSQHFSILISFFQPMIADHLLISTSIVSYLRVKIIH